MDTIRERPLEGFQLGQEFLLQLVIDPGLCLLRCECADGRITCKRASSAGCGI
jgi:hypothetical protein